ncbi:2-oxo acid dehydrogenase subunit E2 [Streptomyces sp. NPDC059496]|uniref:2-oxo acid dehydrogenase subunit E2 n=1 Tax=Streptomyces sp. NPDC059496 TaxID=3346851 RepID=UPI00367F35FB
MTWRDRLGRCWPGEEGDSMSLPEQGLGGVQRAHWQQIYGEHPGMYGEKPSDPATHAAAVFGAAGARKVLELVSHANREIPHYYLSTKIDLAAAMAWMRDRNAGRPVAERLVPAALLLKSVALAARQVPELNGYWKDEALIPSHTVRLGVAVSLYGGGLVTPALTDADTMSLPELMATLRGLVSRARGGRLRASETTDPTLTVTNLGDQGLEAVFGVIYPPQVALVGLGRVIEQPVAVAGMLTVHPTVTATLSADDRASDWCDRGAFPDVHRSPAPTTGGPVNRDEALVLIKDVLTDVVPGADAAALS